MRVKEKNEKAGLKLNIQKGNGIWSHHFTANKKEKVKTVTNFIFLGSKITADGDCNHEIKRHSLEESESKVVSDSLQPHGL